MDVPGIDPKLTKEELAGWVIAFGLPHATRYADRMRLAEGSLHHAHYDILKRCGCPMTGIARWPSDDPEGR